MQLIKYCNKFLLKKYILFISCLSFLIIYLPVGLNKMLPFYFKTSLKLFCVLVVFVLYILDLYKERKCNFFIFSYIIIAIITVIASIIHNHNAYSAIYNDLLLITTLIFALYLSFKYCFIEFLYFLSILNFIIILLNFFVTVYEIVFNVNWWDVCIFWNVNYNYNYFIYFVLSTSILYFLNNNKNLFKILILGYFFIFFDCFFHTAHTTNIAMICIFITFIFVNLNINFDFLFAIINPINSIIYNILFYLIIIVNIGNIPIASFISKSITKDNYNFSGRVELWEFGITKFFENPFGNGLKSVPTLHHAFIHELYEIGILGIGFFIFLIISAAMNIYKINNKKIKLFISVVFFTFLLRFQMASDAKACMYTLLTFFNFLYLPINDYKITH